MVEDAGGATVHSNPWGIKSLAYPVQKKTTGIYWIYQFTAPADFSEKNKIAILHYEQVITHMITKLHLPQKKNLAQLLEQGYSSVRKSIFC